MAAAVFPPKGNEFLDIPRCLYYVKYWFLRKGEQRTSKFPKSQKPVPEILGEFPYWISD